MTNYGVIDNNRVRVKQTLLINSLKTINNKKKLYKMVKTIKYLYLNYKIILHKKILQRKIMMMELNRGCNKLVLRLLC